MTDTPGTAPQAPTEKPASFAEMIDYDAQFAELASKGILFSDEDKEKFRRICDEELKRFNGMSWITSDLGASGTSWMYMLFALIQNMFKGGDGSGFSLSGLGDQFSAASGKAGEQGKLHMLTEATIAIHERFKAEGGKFADAAELVSGESRDGHLSDMNSSIYRQIRSSIDLSFGTGTSLKPGTTPPLASNNPPLTPGRS